MRGARAFLIGFLSLAGLTVAAMPVVNLVVDPLGRYEFFNIPGVNALRTQAGTHMRVSKPGIVCRDRPEAVVIGTSRVGLGIDPGHPGWGAGGRVFNLGMPGMGLRETALTLQHAYFASGRLRTALVGLDFLMFNANREALARFTEKIEFDPGRFVLSHKSSCLQSFLYDIDWWLGSAGLAHSILTVARQMPESDRANPAKVALWLTMYRRDGLMSHAEVFEARVRSGGYRALFGTGAQESYYASVVWLPPPDKSFCFTRGGVNTINTFRDMVRFARQAGIDLRLFIDPLHARLLLALHEAGLGPQFGAWKRQLVQVLADEARESGRPSFSLWDFADINAVTAETVPPEGDLKSEVKWFWEPSHYKKALGDLMLDRILNAKYAASAVPSDFGVLLTPETIETALAADAGRRADYARRTPDDAEMVSRVVRAATKDNRPLPCR